MSKSASACCIHAYKYVTELFLGSCKRSHNTVLREGRASRVRIFNAFWVHLSHKKYPAQSIRKCSERFTQSIHFLLPTCFTQPPIDERKSTQAGGLTQCALFIRHDDSFMLHVRVVPVRFNIVPRPGATALPSVHGRGVRREI